MVSYWVRDNGLGIPEFAKARLFRVFQRFHPLQAEGEGMGLAIAYRIVERHGGKTWAESREGAGSTFNFSLPITQHTAPIEAQEATGDESVRI
jgi:signal transduction histidine kinase